MNKKYLSKEGTIPSQMTTSNNKGIGAGGSNTNKNGLLYEEITDLKDEIKIIKTNKFSETVKFNGYEKLYLKTKQGKFLKCMRDKINIDIIKAHGCKNPDECYIDEEQKHIFIIEKKFQKKSGSVCEKIQTPDFKLWQYSRTFPDFTIIYIYCLSDYFKLNCKAEIEYLDFKKIPYFWGSDELYKINIIKFITNYR